jgi:hypothetical protein
MASRKPGNRTETPPSLFDQARDELFSHIIRCGVLEAAVDHQKEWFGDTMDYLSDRYDTLSDIDLDRVRRLGEQYCRPVIRNSDAVTAGS